jgi:GNAT superfamily N-acetyltransferase/predicted GNAT family acetyltransferase
MAMMSDGACSVMCHWLSAEQAVAYAHLTTPALADELHRVDMPAVEMVAAQGLYAAAMNFAGLPAALAVLQRNERSVLTIESLAVNALFRRLGLARQLLHWLMAEAERLECSRLMVSYPLNHASTAAMQRLTNAALRWQHSPGLRLVHSDRTACLSVVKRLTPLTNRWLGRGRWSLLSWQALDASQLLEVEMLQQEAPLWARPESIECQGAVGQRDEAISQVLLDHGAVAGWLIAHRVGGSVFRVTQWWVTPQLQGSGIALLLMYQALSVALKAIPLYSCVCYGFASDNQSMSLMFSRFLEPLASRSYASQRATITFQ